MGDLVKSGGGGLVGLLHGKGGELSIPKPFEKDIFLFDTYVAGTTHIEGIEELEPHLNNDDRLEFFREPDNRYDMAIQLLKKCQEENRFATPDEQIILSKYVGWGGIPEAFDENNSASLYEVMRCETYI